eukprot:CAMPEP_0197441570 /NCGR_PEP_ID=MMETSP1175-20131217/7817_1 /TAXON_ID=1003142 /ORGANISM="Triceratium dubium, Strain CCMP147" /LENGTH=441 /DNA_ID=CAMNT_0042971873 /DNA_START=558 /DNA_END=1882 /DNA_ORIENTATION=-
MVSETAAHSRRQHPLATQSLSRSSFEEEKKDDGAIWGKAEGSHEHFTEQKSNLCSPPVHEDHPPQQVNEEDLSAELAPPGGGTLALLALCAFGVFACYLLYGLIQERCMSRDSVMGAGPVSSFLVLSQTVTNTMVAFVWTWVDAHLKQSKKRVVASAGGSIGVQRWSELNHRLFFLTSFCYFAAMASSNEALRWVSYPVAVLAKSSKLIPTMMMGVLVDRQCFSGSQWAGAALITSGIVAFNWSRMTEQKDEGGRGDSPFGLALLFLSLVMDGLLASCQGMLKRGNAGTDEISKNSVKTRPPNAIETMLFVNLYACLFLFPASLLSGHFSNGVKLLKSNEARGTGRPGPATWIALLNLTAAGGQVFIFVNNSLLFPTHVHNDHNNAEILHDPFECEEVWTCVLALAVDVNRDGIYWALHGNCCKARGEIKAGQAKRREKKN